jgi:DNA-binding NarL/FixJ family response regulator
MSRHSNRVLILDSFSPQVGRIVQSHLNKVGYECEHYTKNVDDFHIAIKVYCPLFVIIEPLGLVDGMRTVAEICKEYPKLKVVILTENAELAEMARAYFYGVDLYLLKREYSTAQQIQSSICFMLGRIPIISG